MTFFANLKKTKKSQENIDLSKPFSQESYKGALSLGGKKDTHRIVAIVVCMLLMGAGLIYRAYILQIANKDYYIQQGNEFLIGTRTLPVSRGMITDRFGTPLAANGILVNVEFSPYDYAQEYYKTKRKLTTTQNDKLRQQIQEQFEAMNLSKLAMATGVAVETLQQAVNLQEVDLDDKNAVQAVLPTIKNKQNNSVPFRWMLLMKEVTPEQAAAVEALDFVGVSVKVYQNRYYLQGETIAQVLGYMGTTNKDPQIKGRMGIELQYQDDLAGKIGEVQVLKGTNGVSLKQIKEQKPAVESKDITLTIDSRLQYILYRELEALGRQQGPMWTAGIITDIHSGEVLAMGSWPSFNNNNLNQFAGVNARNRPLIDGFEPGSVMKPFTVAAALESGKYNTNTLIDTGVGRFSIGGIPISDGGSYGKISLATLIEKSSNVAAAKIALSLPADAIVNMQKKFGFGAKTQIQFPGQVSGVVNVPNKGDESRRATLAYGYGQIVTLAQLAQAYGVFGSKGQLHPLTLMKGEVSAPVQVIEANNAQAVLSMMELVTMQGGTGKLAAINGYRVAGKTGTARRYDPIQKKYSKESYRNIFAGLAPVSNPKFAVVILAEDPQVAKSAGKSVAPVFSKVMEETLRLYNIPYDKPFVGQDDRP